MLCLHSKKGHLQNSKQIITKVLSQSLTNTKTLQTLCSIFISWNILCPPRALEKKIKKREYTFLVFRPMKIMIRNYFIHIHIY